MTTYTKGKTIGDLLVHYESTQANLFSATITAPASGGPHALANVVGYPVDYNKATKVATLLLAAGQANVDAFLVSGPPFTGLVDSGTLLERYTVVMGTNVVINQSCIATADCSAAASAFTLATITGAAGVADMRFVTQPAKISTQTE